MNTPQRLFLALAAGSLLAVPSAPAQSTYIWANSNVAGTPPASLDWFTGGPNTQGTWTGGDPVSSNLNTIQFFQNATTQVPNTAAPSTQAVNLNNGGTAFQLGTLTLTGRASATSNAHLTMNLSGDPLNFSAAAGTINLDSLNATRTITYNVANNIQLGTAGSASILTLTGSGNNTFNFSGSVSELQAGGGGKLIKSGSSIATLSGAVTVSGGVEVNAGTLALTSAANNITGGFTLNGGALRFSNAATINDKNITVNGSASLLVGVSSSNLSTNASILLNAGSNLSLGGDNGSLTITSAITGDGSITASRFSSGGHTQILSSTANTFKGTISFTQGATISLTVNSLVDSDSPGAGNIRFAEPNSTQTFALGGGAIAPLTLNNRRIELVTSSSGTALIQNNSSQAFTINTDLLVTAASGSRILALGGTGAGLSSFNGAIANGSLTSLALTKSGSGTWVLGNSANSYTGATQVQAGTLVVNKMADYGVNSSIGAATSGPAFTLGFGSILGTLVYEGTGDSTDRFIRLGGQATILNNGTGALDFTAGTFEVTGASTTTAFIIGGSNGGSISGAIPDKNAPSQITAITKTGGGTWVLSGSNTYTGLTTVSGGTLALGHATNTLVDTGAVTVNGATAVLSLGNNDDTVGAVTLTNGSITGTGGTLTATSYAVQSGAITANLGASTATLTKTTAGVVTLSGNNAYTGITTVSAGVLRLDSANALPGGIGATGGTSALTFNTGGVLGLGEGNFTRTLAAAGTVTAATFTGDGGWAAYGADRFVNLNNDSHQIVWATANTGLNAKILYLGADDATHTLDFQNPLDLGTGTRTVRVADGTAAVDAKLSGILSGGTNGSLTKTGAGTLQLTAANSYTGTTTVSAGTLMLAGASGVIASTSRVAINAGATLQISNTSGSDNLGDRLNNAATVAMTSGILNFSHTGDGGTTYSETTGPVTISGTGNRIISSQAATGRTSTLTLGGLSGTLTGLQFEGPGLGDANLRNRILITGRSAGAITGATHYDPLTLLTRSAVYSIAYGVGPLTSDANVNVLGGVIPTGSDAVSIIQAGSSGDITLSSDPTIIASLVQTANQLGTVAMPGQTLRTDAVLLGSPNASLTIGTSPGSGTLTPKTSGGSLTLSNNYPGQLLTINAVIADNGTGSSLAKNGAGTVLITAGATYTGATDISGGTLALTGAGSLPDASAVNLLGSSSVLHLSGISASSETIGSLTGVAGSSVVLGGKNLALNGVAPAPFAGVISGSGGSLTLLAGATQELTGDNTFTGDVTIGAGGSLSVNKIQTTGAQPLGRGTTPIVMQGNVGTGSTLTYTGAGAGATNRGLSLTGGQGGTVNVTAGTLTVNGTLAGSANFHKAGAGTFLLSGGSTWAADGYVNDGTLILGGDSSPGSNSLSAGNWTVATGATMRLNTSGALETSTLTRNGTFNLEAGTLRTNSIAGSGAFVWGAGTIAPLSNLTEGSTDRTDPGGSPSGPVVREGTILDFNGNLATSNGSTLDLGGLFTDNGLRYNQINVTGSLSLAATDALSININPYLLRPNTYSSVFTGDWGTLRFVMADSITGTFDTITGIGTDYLGFAADPGSGNTDTFIDPASLAMNTYYIEYRTSGVLSGAAMLFHYKVAGSVPEPGSAGLLIAGASLIRMLRRRSDNDGSDFFHRTRKMIQRRRSRGRR